ncbi:MAG: hypothetical protein KME17_07625 [Cyanosarcina radialis HA8281-LM2]|jgi:hypothetical protein|nr:hypothetical protein [Cyanosarcina radialis HA8281-LM2]
MIPNNNFHQSEEKSVLSVNLRLSETLLALLLGAGISFGAGFAVANANTQKQTQTQSISCPVTNPASQQKSGKT